MFKNQPSNLDAIQSTSRITIPMMNVRNVEEVMEQFVRTYGCVSNNIWMTLTDPLHKDEQEPRWDDALNLPGVPPNTYLYANKDKTTGALTIKTDLATMESFAKSIQAYNLRKEKLISSEAPIIQSILSNISKESLDLMKTTAGANYSNLTRRLGTTWELIKSSHLKPDTSTMMDLLQDLMTVAMPKGQFYAYAEKINSLSKSFNTVFKKYLAQPLSVFADLLITLTFVSGIDKSDQTFDTAILAIRDLDFNTPSNVPHFPDVLKLLTKAMHSRTLLADRSGDLLGMTTQINLHPVAHSTLTQNVVDTCKTPGCGAIVPYAVDARSKHVHRYCNKCFSELRMLRKKTGLLTREKPSQREVLHSNSFPVIPKKPQAVPKPQAITSSTQRTATATAFTGKNPNLALSNMDEQASAAEQFLNNFEEFQTDDSDSTL